MEVGEYLGRRGSREDRRGKRYSQKTRVLEGRNIHFIVLVLGSYSGGKSDREPGHDPIAGIADKNYRKKGSYDTKKHAES